MHLRREEPQELATVWPVKVRWGNVLDLGKYFQNFANQVHAPFSFSPLRFLQ